MDACDGRQHGCELTVGTGSGAAGRALAGLVLGWGAVILSIVLIAVALALAAGTYGAMPMR